MLKNIDTLTEYTNKVIRVTEELYRIHYQAFYLSTNLKIQNARLSLRGGFDTIADDVNELTERSKAMLREVQENLMNFINSSNLLLHLSENVRSNMQRVLNEAIVIGKDFEEIFSSVKSVSNELMQVMNSVDSQHQISSNIVTNIDESIKNIHVVIDTVSRLFTNKSFDYTVAFNRSGQQNTSPVGNIVESDEVQSAVSEIPKTIGKLVEKNRDLEAILKKLTTIVNNTKMIFLEAHLPFMHVEEKLNHFISDLHRTAELRHSVDEVMRRVTNLKEIIEFIRKTISHIVQFSEDIELISLNASIQASQVSRSISERSKVFSAMADGIRDLSNSIIGPSQTIIDSCDDIIKITESIGDFSIFSTKFIEQTNAHIEKINFISSEIKTILGEVFSSIGDVSKLNLNLSYLTNLIVDKNNQVVALDQTLAKKVKDIIKVVNDNSIN